MCIRDRLYGEDMPIEEAGNMILVTTAISMMEGNANYASKYWETLSTLSLIHIFLLYPNFRFLPEAPA